MKHILVFTLILFCSLSAFAQTKKTGGKSSQEKTVVTKPSEDKPQDTQFSAATDEEYKVFTAVLGKDKENFVIQYKTDATDYMNYSDSFIKRKMPDLKDETFDDFNAKNANFALMERKFDTKKNYFVLNKAENDKLSVNRKFNWEAFSKKYPKSGGFYIFSRVGFSKNSEQALVLVTFSCGGSCGQGTYYFLQKENNEWKTVKSQTTWKS